MTPLYSENPSCDMASAAYRFLLSESIRGDNHQTEKLWDLYSAKTIDANSDNCRCCPDFIAFGWCRVVAIANEIVVFIQPVVSCHANHSALYLARLLQGPSNTTSIAFIQGNSYEASDTRAGLLARFASPQVGGPTAACQRCFSFP